MKANEKIVGLLHSFFYAIRGIFFCIKTERNIRIHMSITFYVLVFSKFYDFTRSEFAIILLSIALVITAEMLNTATEASVDISSPNYSELAKKSKDIAAGGVLISAIFAFVIGITFFWDIETIYNIIQYFGKHTVYLIGLIVSVVLWLVFIFSVEPSKKLKFIENKK